MAISGKLTFPGDKSISHRALMLAALADGQCQITNLSTGVDVDSTRKCLESCGIKIEEDGSTLLINGGPFQHPTMDLDCGNSGTTVRLLIGLLAGQGIKAKFVGDASLSKRPMKRIMDPLTQMGANIKSTKEHLPILLESVKLNGIQYSPSIASAQVKSAVLLAGLKADGPTTVIEPIKTRDHTEQMLLNMNADIRINGNEITISPFKSKLSPFNMFVPADPSTAAFFAAAPTLVKGSDLVLSDVSINPTRIGFFSVLKQMGGNIKIDNERTECWESRGDIHIKHSELRGITLDNEAIPGLIDELPILAILATQAEGITEVRGAEELRVKECDRLHAICSNLLSMGASITELDDGFIIQGPTKLKGGKINTFRDHRIAMAFTIAGLIAKGEIVLDNKNCVNISYPQFFEALESVMEKHD